MSTNYRIPLMKTDSEAYREGYDRVFGAKKKLEEAVKKHIKGMSEKALREEYLGWDANGSPTVDE